MKVILTDAQGHMIHTKASMSAAVRSELRPGLRYHSRSRDCGGPMALVNSICTGWMLKCRLIDQLTGIPHLITGCVLYRLI